MKYIHLAFAVLAAWRIVELFTMDRITEPLRKKFPSYLLQCQRCLSVWAGAYVSLAFVFVPYLNWPFAISWLYFVHNDMLYQHRLRKGREFRVEVTPDNRVNLLRSELTPSEIQSLLSQMIIPAQGRPPS
jgi:hypothetical protein